MTAAPAGARTCAVSAPRWVTTTVIFFVATLGLLYEALATAVTPSHAVVWGGLAMAAYAATLLCFAGAQGQRGLGFTRWRFGSWTLLWYGLAFGVATLTWIQPQTGPSAEIAISSVLRALWLVAVGMTLWALGYFVGPGRSARRLGNRVVSALGRRFAADVRSPLAPWILYAIGLAARIASTVATGHFGYVGNVAPAVSTSTGYQQLLYLLALCCPLGVSAAALQVYRERLPGARVSLPVLFLAELALGAAAGGKESFVVEVLAVAIPFSAARRRLPALAIIVLSLVFLELVVPFNLAYRHAVRTGSVPLAPSQAVAAAPQILRQTVTGQSLATALPSSLTYLLQRIREIDSPAIIVQRTPGQIAFGSPAQLVEAPVADMVPRAIWPAKPIMANGYQFSQQYYELPSSMYTSSSITPVGDLYWHGGWVPVVLGMFLLGCGVRLLDDVLDVWANPHAVFLVLLLFPSIVKNEVDWVVMLAGIPGMLFLWLVAVPLTFRRRRAA